MDRRPPPGANYTNRRQQLRVLASEHGVLLATRKPLLESPGYLNLPQFSKPEHHQQATALLAGARKTSENYKDPSKKLVNRFKSQNKKDRLDRAENWNFGVDERCALLEQNVRESGDVGVSQALLEYKKDNLYEAANTAPSPTTKLVKKLSKATVEPDAWLTTAVATGDIPHVILLASRRPGTQSLNRAFEAALSSNTSATIAEELLKYGADPNEQHNKFMVLVHQRSLDKVEALLRSPRPLQPLYLNTALLETVRSGNFELVALLLSYGADPNHQGAECFLATIRASHLKMTYLLLVGAQEHVQLKSEYLDHAVSVLVEEAKTDKTRYDFLQALLCAGASPDSRSTEGVIFAAVKSAHRELVQLLISYGTSVDHEDARCFRAAFEKQDFGLFELLLQGRLTPVLLARSLPQAMSSFHSHEQRLHAVQLLLEHGIKGPEVDQAFATSIQQDDNKLFNVLLKANVDLNYREGLAIEHAFLAHDSSYLEAICGRPSIKSGTASRLVPLALDPKTYWFARSAILIKACKAHTAVLDKALTDEIVMYGAREETIQLLLDNGASVEASHGAAIYQAVLAGNQRAAQQLANAGPSHLVLHSAFRAVMSLDVVSTRFAIMKILLEKAGSQKIGQDDALVQETRNAAQVGTDIVDLLLKHKASVDLHDGNAVKAAIEIKSYPALQLLLASHPNKEALTIAFSDAMSLPKEIRIQYATAIAQEAVQTHSALPVGSYLENAIAENDVELAKLLLHYGADPNVENGRAFVDSAGLPSTTLFEELLLYRPDIKRLLPALIGEVQSEERVISCLRLCFERLEIHLRPSENVLLFLALDKFEQGHELVKFLLDAGCSPGVVRDLQLKPGGQIEPVTPLIWALSRPLPGPSRAVILTMLERGAEVKPNYITPLSQTTALLEAAKTARHTIVAKLLSLGAKVNAQDVDGKSALLLASECGDLASAEALLQARVKANDGSLHAAARGAHEAIVKLLLEHSHTPNHIHGGLNSLAELCRNGHPLGTDWNERCYWVIDVLMKYGTNIDARFSGKHIVHLALDNDMPLPISKALLDFPQFSEHLNDESFLFEDGLGTVYSPISYAETFYNGPPEEKANLMKLLSDKNCTRNMWNRQGRHPPNYTYNTMPAHLKAMVDQEKLEELKQAKALQRRQEEARIERELADRNHKHLMDQAAARQRHEALEAQQREAREAAADMRRREAEKRHKHELAMLEAQRIQNNHQLEINQQAALATQRQQIEDRDRARAFQHQKQMNTLEAQREQERTTNQKALAWEQDRANEQQHIRHLQLLDKQDQSVRMRANEMRSVANAAKAANTNVGIAGPSGRPPKQIGFGDDWATVD